ncbi:MAG: hypothetical protein LBO82_10790 [Synergistaceae bacterium]|jgi:hypothetical protein|nr:hypothetical protein [Synergistaceae bacterium]
MKMKMKLKMKKPRMFFVLAASLLAGAAAAEAGQYRYTREIALFKTLASGAGGDIVLKDEVGPNETLVLKPNKTLYLYVKVLSAALSPTLSDDAGSYTAQVGIPENLQKQSIGNPAAEVTLHFNNAAGNANEGRDLAGTLLISTSGVLDAGVARVQLVTRLFGKDGKEVFPPENGLLTNTLNLRLGYDDNRGGGGCGVPGTGAAAFLLPVIPLIPAMSSRAKRRRTER